MKKTKLLTIPVLTALALSGCASAPTATNKAPSVVGVKDIQCMVNSTVDFLDGVAALDYEDGDITPALDITVTPHVDVVNGYAYFTEEGEYTVNYKITDSEGRTAQKRAYVDVFDREEYKSFAMPEGFSARAYGSAKIEKCGMEDGEFKLEAKGGEIAEDVKLTRTYSLPAAYSQTNYVQYTFKYTVNSDCAGKIKAMADDEDCAELAVKEGKNVLVFKYTAKYEENSGSDVKMELCLGGLGDLKWTVEKVEIEYPQEEGKLLELAEDFNFAGKVESRMDNDGGKLPLVGNAWAGSEGRTACLKIEKAAGGEGNQHLWRGGMFINTGIAIKAGVTYTVTFDIDTDNDSYFEVLFQHTQWVDDKLVIAKLFQPETGEMEFTVPDDRAGNLWLYVQSGSYENEIRISNLSVIEHLGSVGKETVSIEDFGCGGGTIRTGNGGFAYTVANFGADSGNNEVTSPSFYLAGSGANYVITFKAKASKPIEMIVCAPVYGGWDPTVLWQRITLTEEETLYTFYCNGNGSDRLYRIVWQFGSTANQKYNDVEIEISGIKVSFKNGELDG